LDAQYYFQLQRIPDNFVRKHGAQLSNVATVTVPGGTVWRLGLKKVDNCISFVDGWQDFIERYSIDIGYLLVFTYEGKSNFIVYIFRTAEIDYYSTMRSRVEGPFHQICNPIFEGIEDIDSFDFLDSAPSNPTGALQGNDSTGCMDQLIPAENHIQQRQENQDTKKTSRKKLKMEKSHVMVFTLSVEEGAEPDNLIKGICFINNSHFLANINIGVTYSFISLSCAKRFNLVMSLMLKGMVIDTPANGSVTTSLVCLNYPLNFGDVDFKMDLTCLPLEQMDVIFDLN
jgi:hypothetical protein